MQRTTLNDKQSPMHTLLLNDGNTIPLLGLGTYKSTGSDGRRVVAGALQMGYRLIDTAAKYGNEAEVGRGIRDSGIPRGEIFVVSKLWRESLGYRQAKAAFHASLQQLGLGYLDLYLIHWPANARNYPDWQQVNAATWQAMEELQAEGWVRSVGVSNFWPAHLDALLQTASVVPAVNQIEFHPGYHQPDVARYCREKGIALQAWSPLARGKIFGNEVLQCIAAAHGKTVSQVALRWIVQQQVVALPKASSPEKMQQNLQVFDFELTEAEMQQIGELPETGFSGELPDLWPERVSS